MYVFVCMGVGAYDSPKQFRIEKEKALPNQPARKIPYIYVSLKYVLYVYFSRNILILVLKGQTKYQLKHKITTRQNTNTTCKPLADQT